MKYNKENSIIIKKNRKGNKRNKNNETPNDDNTF